MNTKKLYRSSSNKVFAGVCGGIGEYLGVDPTLIRIAFILLAVMSRFSIVIVYFLCWAIMPQATDW